jgi:hypothetical protein
VATPKSRSEAKKAFAHGMKLQKSKRLDEALSEFEKAADLVPQDVIRDLARNGSAAPRCSSQRGNTALANGSQVQALGGSGCYNDPTNDFAASG